MDFTFVYRNACYSFYMHLEKLEPLNLRPPFAKIVIDLVFS